MTFTMTGSIASDTLTIRGGRPLQGDITIRGAKNSVPKNLVAALLAPGHSTLHNVAQIQDVPITCDMITALGGNVTAEGTSIRIAAQDLHPMDTDTLESMGGRSRIPILLCGPLLARLGQATVPNLGGCRIGPRPIDYHLNALRQLGATIDESPTGIHLRAKRLVGAKINLPYPSVGATEQVLLSAVIADGITQLSNAAMEPEIIDLIGLLQKMGAIISIESDRIITIVGVDQLRGYEHTAMPDRLEAASWACAALATGGRIYVHQARQLDMIAFLNQYRLLGGDFEVCPDGIVFWRAGETIRSVALETDVHPGFMTDWQQPCVVALTQADGVSIVHETVYEDRFGYIDALNQMGAKIQLYNSCLGSRACRFSKTPCRHSAVIVGSTPLTGANIHIPDLRAGFSYVIAALVADGTSTISNMPLINRGYEDFTNKLQALGVDIVS